MQQGFFFAPFFDPGAFDLTRQTEQPVTLGTLFTVGSSVSPAPQFTGSVMVVTGDRDYPFAGGDAYAGQNGLTKPEEVQSDLYPNVNNFATFIPQNTGEYIITGPS